MSAIETIPILLKLANQKKFKIFEYILAASINQRTSIFIEIYKKYFIYNIYA